MACGAMIFQDKDFDEKDFLEGAKDAFFTGDNLDICLRICIESVKTLCLV